MNRLSRGEQLFGGAGLLLFILSFISPWATVSVAGFGHQSFNGWDAFGPLVKFGFILAILGAGLAVAKAANLSMEIPPVVYLVAGALVGLIMLLATALGPSDEGADLLPGVDVSRGFLLFVGLVLGLVMAYGGWLIFKQQPATSAAAPPAAPPPAT